MDRHPSAHRHRRGSTGDSDEEIVWKEQTAPTQEEFAFGYASQTQPTTDQNGTSTSATLLPRAQRHQEQQQLAQQWQSSESFTSESPEDDETSPPSTNENAFASLEALLMNDAAATVDEPPNAGHEEAEKMSAPQQDDTIGDTTTTALADKENGVVEHAVATNHPTETSSFPTNTSVFVPPQDTEPLPEPLLVDTTLTTGTSLLPPPLPSTFDASQHPTMRTAARRRNDLPTPSFTVPSPPRGVYLEDPKPSSLMLLEKSRRIARKQEQKRQKRLPQSSPETLRLARPAAVSSKPVPMVTAKSIVGTR